MLIFFLIGLSLYSRAIFFNFIWDDESLIAKNPLVKPPFKKEIFTTTLFYPKVLRTPFYRPLQTLSYFFDYKIGDLNPKIFHFTNIFLHILNSVLLFLIIFRLFSNEVFSLFVSLLFLIHPLNVESVCYVSGRADLLMGLFILGSFYSFLIYQAKKKIFFLFISGSFFFLGLFSKESALIFPLWIFLYLKCIKKESFKESFKYSFFFFLFVFFYGIWRIFILKIPSSVSLQNIYPPLLRFLTLPQVISQYLVILFFPVNLHMARNVVIFDEFNFLLLFQWLLLCLFLFFLFKTSQKSFCLKFSLLFSFCFLLPNLPPFPQNAFLAEHFLYLAQIGVWIIISEILLSKKFHFFLISWLIFLGFMNFKTASFWKDDKTLYQRTIQLSPNSFAVYNNLGTIYLKEGKVKKAKLCFKKALEINPNFLEAKLNLARLYYLIGKLDKAIKIAENVSKEAPSYYLSFEYLGVFYTKKRDFLKAEYNFKKALQINSFNPLIWYDLYLFYREKGDFKKAELALEKAGFLDREYLAEVYFIKSEEFLEKGDLNKSLEYINKALTINDSDYRYFNLKGVILKNMGKFQEAIIFYKKALTLNPKSVLVYTNLGVLAALLNKENEAEFCFKKALSLNKESFEANLNLGFFYLRKGKQVFAQSYLLRAKNINPEKFSQYKEFLKRKDFKFKFFQKLSEY